MDTASPQNRMRSQAQNRAMHGLANQLTGLAQVDADAVPAEVFKAGAPDEPIGVRWLRSICLKVSKQTRSSALTEAQAAEVISALTRAVEAMKRAIQGVPEARTVATVTPEQWTYIEKLCTAISRLEGRYSEMAGSRQKMQHWCIHYLKVAWPQTQRDADVCLEALKSILQRSLPSKEQLGAELAELYARQVELDEWPCRFVRDGHKRSRKWGSLQWAKLHEIYVNTTKTTERAAHG